MGIQQSIEVGIAVSYVLFTYMQPSECGVLFLVMDTRSFRRPEEADEMTLLLLHVPAVEIHKHWYFSTSEAPSTC